MTAHCWTVFDVRFGNSVLFQNDKLGRDNSQGPHPVHGSGALQTPCREIAVEKVSSEYDPEKVESKWAWDNLHWLDVHCGLNLGSPYSKLRNPTWIRNCQWYSSFRGNHHRHDLLNWPSRPWPQQAGLAS